MTWRYQISHHDSSKEALYSRYGRLSAFLLDHSMCPSSLELDLECPDMANCVCRVNIQCPACPKKYSRQVSYPDLLQDVSGLSHMRPERLEAMLLGEANGPRTEAIVHSFLLAVAAECLVEPDGCLSRNDP